ncbi:MAG: peptidylprolyl isomerase [Sulfurospirillum sp.]|nr:peptidylprolyl isomerase [Sulfurospirillum sp.]MBL0703850.1 peptidylprolyl isomerase [Sulfurospirillum sp.]
MAISDNQVVSISYELKDANSKEVVDSNLDTAPLTFILGKGQIIAGLENEIKNLSEGENANIKVSAKDGYGEYDEVAVQSLPKEQFAGLEMTKGMTLYGEDKDGGTVQVIVKSFDDEIVNVDFNHPLAGKDLLFSISIIEVREATKDELINGFVATNSGGCGCKTGDSCNTKKDKKADDHECCGGGGGGGCGSH